MSGHFRKDLSTAVAYILGHLRNYLFTLSSGVGGGRLPSAVQWWVLPISSKGEGEMSMFSGGDAFQFHIGYKNFMCEITFLM